jgi:hypothetical protein
MLTSTQVMSESQAYNELILTIQTRDYNTGLNGATHELVTSEQCGFSHEQGPDKSDQRATGAWLRHSKEYIYI